MAQHARRIALLGTLLAIGAMAPVTGALASSTPAPVETALTPAVVCALNANTDLMTASVIAPTAMDVLANDCAGAATASRPLTITAVTQGTYGSVTHDGRTIVYNPTACRTGNSDGNDFFTYTMTDGTKNGTAPIVKTGTVIVSFVRPTGAPVNDVPTAGFVSGSTIGSTVPLKLSWCGVPASGSSVKSYRVEQSTNAAASFPTLVTSSTTGTSSTRNAKLSTSYAWRIKTTDSKSRTSPAYAQSLVSRVGSVQDSGGKIVYSYGWKTATSSRYSGGKEHAVTRKSATATLTVTNVRQFAIVASRGTSRGSFYVYVDGKRVTASAITQRSSSSSWRRVLYVGGIPGSTAGTHTIQVRTTSTARIALDTILTLTGKPAPVVSFVPPTPPAAAIVNGTSDTVAASSSSGLPVTLSLDPTSWTACSLANGVVNYHGRGTCLVRATQAVDPSWDAATAPWSYPVAGLPQAITFDPLVDRTYGDPDIALAATSDASPALTVTLSSQTPLVCSVTGTTASILAAGTCTIRASQAGDATRATAAPVDRSFTVATVDLTVTGITATDRQYNGTAVATLGTTGAALVGVLGTDNVTLVTTGAAGAFDDANVGVGKTVQVSGLTLAGTKAGNYSLTQPTATATITKADQLITFATTAPPNPVKAGPTYTPAATSDSGLTVAITVDSIPGGVCSIDGGGVVSFTGSGTCVVNADQAGDANHSAADRQVQNLTVASTGSAPQAITFTTPGPATYGDPAVSLDAASDSLLPVTMVSLDPGVCTIAGATAVIATAGDCRITASQAGDPTYAAALSVTRTLRVNPLAITVTAVAATKTYDGDVTSAGTPTITTGTLAAGDNATWGQVYDTPIVGTGKTLTPSGTVLKGLADVTGSYDITFVPVGTGVINPGPAATLTVSGFSTPTTAGVAHTVTVSAKDAFGNTATGYTGTVHLSSGDAQAVFPGDYHFVLGDAGVRTFTNAATLKTAGTQTITATDTVTPSITGSQTSITVNAAAAATLVVAATSPQVAGTPFTITVTAKDLYGNTATGYTGTVHFTSTDAGAGASVPGDYHFLVGDAGVRPFTNGVVAVTATPVTITATDTGNGAVTGNTGPVTINPAGAATLTVAATSPQVAGTPFTVTVTATDGFGNTAVGYTGTVHFSSTDGGATLPTDDTFTGGDAGVQVLSGVILTEVGSQSITATDTVTATITGTRSGITVNPGSATQLTVSGFTTPAIAGQTHSVTVTAKDASGNVATGYTGTVHFTSGDAQATLPSNYTFTGGNAGVRTFSGVALKTVGTQAITATDIGNGSITGIQSGITVNPAGASTLIVSGYPSPTIAGASHPVTITAHDAFGNVATGYTGQVHLTSSDGSATVAGNYTFTGGDAGVHSLAVTLRTVGTQSITATDTGNGSINGTQSSITVNPDVAATLTVVATTSHTAGIAFTVTVTAKDGSSNTAVGYTGTIHFTGTDGGATLPGDYTFTGGDAGVHVFTSGATLRTAGTQSITATDSGNGSITGTQTGITVTAATTASLAVSGYPSPTVAGASHNVTVTAKDAFNNTVTSFAGTVAITSSDGLAVLPSDNPLASGTRTFAVTLGTVGTQTITATQVGNPSITGTQGSVTVNPGTATHFTVSGFTTPTTAGQAHNVTVTARDAFNNTATGYAGTIHFTSSDAQAVVPANGGLTSGTGTFSVTLKTAGTRSITATDTVAGTINGTQGSITVDPAGATTLTVAATSPQVAGTAFNATVTAKDPYSNTATGYTGTVHFTSTDAEAVLPADYQFLVANAGVHVFTGGMTLTEEGSETITATDTGAGTITGTSGSIVVNPGAAVDLRVTGFPASAVAGSLHSVIVTARDQYGNTATGFAGTVHLTSSDGQAVLAANSTLTAGTHTFAVTLKTAGTQAVTATDTVNGTITGTQGGITVTANVAADIAIEDSPTGSPPVGADSVQSGSGLTFYANSVDTYGNFVANVTATWSLTGKTGGVANGDLVPAGDTRSAVLTGNLVGTATVHAVAAAGNDDTGTITVTAGPTATVSVEDANTGLGDPVGAQDLAAGSSITVYPVSRDAAGNFVGVFSSTFQLVSKTGGVVDADLTTPTSQRAVLTGHLVGSAIIRATTGAIPGDSGAITVVPGAVASLGVTADPSQTQDVPFDVTVTALDGEGNVVTGYLGEVAITSSAGIATLPGPYAFQPGDAGVATLSVTIGEAGTRTVTATDTGASTIHGTSGSIVVS